MSKEFPCKWNCGAMLHFDNGKLVQGDNSVHDCPLAPWKQKTGHNSELAHAIESQNKILARIADALEYLARK